MELLPDRPRVRAVEAVPLGDGYAVADPTGLSSVTLQMSPAAVLILSLCDGTRTCEEICQGFRAESGQRLHTDQLREFLESVDAALMLDSPRFRDEFERKERAFAAASWREAAHAGAAYEENPARLAHALDSLLDAERSGPAEPRTLTGLIAPHIDLQRGGAGYAKAYATLRDRTAPELVVIVGTGHHATEGRFIVCDKGFRTPAGELRCDDDFLARLSRRLRDSHQQGLLAHATEHSIEFQALFLSHLFGDSPPTIVPILCTSFDDCLERGQLENEAGQFLDALAETYAEESRRTLLIAAADLSHVGPRFGDRVTVDQAFLDRVREDDLAALEGVVAANPEQFLGTVAAYKNRNRICSVGAIYTVLHTLAADRGDLLGYEQAAGPDGDLCVSFAAAALYGSTEGRGLPLRSPAGDGT